MRQGAVICPACTGTGTFTYEDRHTGTREDTCTRCGGEGEVPLQTGETPEAAYSPPTKNDTGEKK